MASQFYAFLDKNEEPAIAKLARELYMYGTWPPPGTAQKKTSAPKAIDAYGPTLPAPDLIWNGFTGRFSGLYKTITEHYILVPTIFAGTFGAALAFSWVGTGVTVAAVGMISYELLSAGADLYRGNRQAGLHQVGEGVADTMLLGTGLSVGAGLKTLTGAKNMGNAFNALHVIDDVPPIMVMFSKLLKAS